MGPTGIDLAAFRTSIGLWVMVVGGGHRRCQFGRLSSLLKSRSLWISLFYLFLLLHAVSLLRHGDVHQNPGLAALPRSPSASQTSSVDAANGPSHSKASLSVLHLNTRSILPKMTELSLLTFKLRLLIVAVSESWLSPSVPVGAVFLPGYNSIVRADR